jgi:hypothetical protein
MGQNPVPWESQFITVISVGINTKPYDKERLKPMDHVSSYSQVRPTWI